MLCHDDAYFAGRIAFALLRGCVKDKEGGVGKGDDWRMWMEARGYAKDGTFSAPRGVALEIQVGYGDGRSFFGIMEDGRPYGGYDATFGYSDHLVWMAYTNAEGRRVTLTFHWDDVFCVTVST